MANKNVLEGLRCPECKAEEPFRIEVTTIIQYTDDGSDIDDKGSDEEWDDDSFCMCVGCGFEGTIHGFLIGNQEEKERKKARAKKGEGPAYCPECGEEQVSKVEAILGLAGIMPSSQKPGWEYDGNGTEVEWDSQTDTGLSRCSACGHEWGAVDPDALKHLFGNIPQDKYLTNFHHIVTTGVACGLTHPIEWASNAHRTPGGTMSAEYYAEIERHIPRFLCDAFELGKQRKPRSADQVLQWINDFYKPGHLCHKCFDFLKEKFKEEIKRRA